MIDDSWDWQIVDALRPEPGDHIIRKSRYSGFCNTKLEATLRARKIRHLLFTGVATNASVEGTARGASDLGYRTVVVADACSAGSPEAHAASLESLGLLAEIATTDEVLAGLAQPAAANA